MKSICTGRSGKISLVNLFGKNILMVEVYFELDEHSMSTLETGHLLSSGLTKLLRSVYCSGGFVV